ncbi:hypothetical protein Leryth_001045 [Lithospermum erythrorhizon]|nr:hypothetical protein Leryth_001045 [Lithospermum erythrorhizon]
MEKLISSENVAFGEIIQEIEHLSISLVDEGSFAVKKPNSNMKLLWKAKTHDWKKTKSEEFYNNITTQ